MVRFSSLVYRSSVNEHLQGTGGSEEFAIMNVPSDMDDVPPDADFSGPSVPTLSSCWDAEILAAETETESDSSTGDDTERDSGWESELEEDQSDIGSDGLSPMEELGEQFEAEASSSGELPGRFSSL